MISYILVTEAERSLKMYGHGLIKKYMCCIAAALLAAGAVSLSQSGSEMSASASPESNEYEQRLAELDKQQAALDEKLAAAEGDAASRQEKLNAVSEKLKSLKAEEKEIEEYSSKLIDEMVEADDSLRQVSHRLEEQETAIKKEVKEYSERMRALYLAGSGSYANIILTSGDFFDVLMRTELVKRVAGHDKETIERLLEEQRTIENTKAEIEKKSNELKNKTAEYSARREQLEKSIEEQKQLTEKYQAELEKLGLLSDELAEQSRQLEEERAEVSSKAAAATTTTTTTTAATTTTAGTSKATTTQKSTTETTASTARTTTVTAGEKQTETAKTTTQAATKATTAAATKATTAATTASAPVSQTSDRDAKIKKVVDYALSNVGGAYVWGGASYRATDCSGLTMLAYAQIGINIPHWTVTQAQQGWAVSYNELQPGDLVFFGGSSYSSVYHAAMYIGGGKIVHAENSNTGIVISDLARFSVWNPISCMKRLI